MSTDGGRNPVWHPHGGELFYQLNDGVFAVPIANGRRVGAPVRLFNREGGGGDRNWDLAPDGQRFLVGVSNRVPPQIDVVKNWFEELKAKVPRPR